MQCDSVPAAVASGSGWTGSPPTGVRIIPSSLKLFPVGCFATVVIMNTGPENYTGMGQKAGGMWHSRKFSLLRTKEETELEKSTAASSSK